MIIRGKKVIVEHPGRVLAASVAASGTWQVARNGGSTSYRAQKAEECAWKRALRPSRSLLYWDHGTSADYEGHAQRAVGSSKIRRSAAASTFRLLYSNGTASSLAHGRKRSE
jgi:hypothetical protein